MRQLNLKPTHKLVKSYYQVLGQFGQLNIDHEMAVRSAFQDLLKVHLIGQVVSVSLETMKIVKSLPRHAFSSCSRCWCCGSRRRSVSMCAGVGP
jgi:hypothetical protein